MNSVFYNHIHINDYLNGLTDKEYISICRTAKKHQYLWSCE